MNPSTSHVTFQDAKELREVIKQNPPPSFYEEETANIKKNARIVATNSKGKVIYTSRTIEFVESAGSPENKLKALYFIPKKQEIWGIFVGLLRNAQDTMNIDFNSEDIKLSIETNFRLRGQRYEVKVLIEEFRESPMFQEGMTMSQETLKKLVQEAQERANAKPTLIMDRQKRRELERNARKPGNWKSRDITIQKLQEQLRSNPGFQNHSIAMSDATRFKMETDPSIAHHMQQCIDSIGEKNRGR